MRPYPALNRRLLASFGIVGLLVLGQPWIAAQNRRTSAAEPDTQTVVHVLNRIGYGARPGDVARVKAMGLTAYVDEQLQPERIDNAALEARLSEFQTLDMSTAELAEKYFVPAMQLRRDQVLREQRAAAQAEGSRPPDEMMPNGERPAPAAPPVLSPEARMVQAGQQNVINELVQAKMLRAVLSERQLEEVLSDFWFNHFNVFIGKGQVRQYLTSYERDVIRPHVLGRFRDLLGAVAHSPAMLFYLDNWQSATPNPPQMLRPGLGRGLRLPRMDPDAQRQMLQRAQQRPARGLNENYARELMELHTLGVDGGYTQQDVVELARILTGWTIDRPQLGGGFVFRPQMHDNGTKTLLGVTFRAGGESEGERALDLLAAHPSTARHISYKLAQRFVADEPPPALVARAAKVFTDTRGDLRQVVRTIVTSPEFFSPDAIRAKVKTPLEFVVSAVRATGATVTNGQPLVIAMRNLGMPLYGCQPPTGYSTTADAWVNTGSLLNRMNFAVQLVSGGRILPDERVGRGAPPIGPPPPDQAVRGRGRGPLAARRAELQRGPISIDLPAMAPDTTEASRDRLIEALLSGQASEATRQTLARAQHPQQLVALALGSPEFQRR
jgi:uncharacterized protein (DUF1800 family)